MCHLTRCRVSPLGSPVDEVVNFRVPSYCYQKSVPSIRAPVYIKLQRCPVRNNQGWEQMDQRTQPFVFQERTCTKNVPCSQGNRRNALPRKRPRRKAKVLLITPTFQLGTPEGGSHVAFTWAHVFACAILLLPGTARYTGCEQGNVVNTASPIA